ncbi:MAG: hypothetical protein VX127_00535 [Myxococcota bacterium]|nr:hypothetical protein [Myxococcota bacterium]
MPLYSESLLNNFATAAGCSESILQQMAAGPERAVLAHLGHLYDEVATPVQERWKTSLVNMDNRRFFQGYAEAVSAAFFTRSGWSVVDVCHPKPCLVLRHSDGRELHLVTLAFLQPEPDPAARTALETLTRVVNRAEANHRITILVRRWTPHDFDPEPVRRCIDIWLEAIAKGTWHGRYATFEDDHISLEFTRTDTPIRPGEGAVAFLIAPENGLRTMEVIETRLVYEIDTLLSKGGKGTPVMTSLVTNTSWTLPPGTVRSLFYGRPLWQVANGQRSDQRFGFELGSEPALFHEPQYAAIAGALMIDRPNDRGPCGRAYLNPWARQALAGADMACATFSSTQSDGDFRVMHWG